MTVCMLRYIEMTDTELLEDMALKALAARCEVLPAFAATHPADVVYPFGD